MVRLAGTVSKGWMAETLDVAFDRDYYLDPLRRHAIDSLCQKCLHENFRDLNLFFTESNLGRLPYHEPRHVLVGGIQPNMILGMLVGAEFVANDRMDADIAPTPLRDVEPDELPAPERLLQHDVIRRFEDQLRTVRDETDGRLEPVPPFFWDSSGRAAIHGALTTAQKLFGESVFLDLMTRPERGVAILDWTMDVSIALVDHFAKLAGRTITNVHVGECSACMVGADVFETFVVPTISRVGQTVGPVRLHSCGTSDHLLDSFPHIDNLRVLDVGGGTSMAAIRNRFGVDFPVDMAPLVDDLLAPSPDALLAWAESILKENAGGPLTIGYHVEPGCSFDNLHALQDLVIAMNR